MKKLFIIFSVALLAVSCTGFDDSAIWDELNDHKDRIERLEEVCSRLNANILALQEILDAISRNDYVTNVEKIIEDGVEIGYSLTFAKGGTVTIYHGCDGADGGTPKIGVRKAADGGYYWTSDGEWLTDDDGARIPAVVADDGDGRYITPKFRISDGVWYISFDGGNSWREFTKMNDSIDDILDTIVVDSDYVYLYMADGQVIKVAVQGDSIIDMGYGAITQMTRGLNFHPGKVSGPQALLNTNSSYNSWSYTVPVDCKIYMGEGDAEKYTYFSLSVVPAGSSSGVRYRYYSDENTLPTVDAPLDVKAGSIVYVSVGKSVQSWAFYTTDVLTTSASREIMDAIASNQLILQHSYLSDASQGLLILKRCGNRDDLFLGQNFMRIKDDKINSNCWRLGTLDLYKRIGDSFVIYKKNLIRAGEWECAIKEVGAADFMGGNAHGDEQIVSINAHLDGKSLDLSSNFVTTGFSLEIIRNSLLNRCDTPGDNVIDHMVRYCITPETITIYQTVEWLQDMTLEASYLLMCPISREYTSSAYIDGRSDIVDVSYAGHSTPKLYGNIGHFSLWGDNFSVRIEYECLEGAFGSAYSFISASTSPPYNKFYYNFVGVGVNESVKAGCRVSTLGKISYSYNE